MPPDYQRIAALVAIVLGLLGLAFAVRSSNTLHRSRKRLDNSREQQPAPGRAAGAEERLWSSSLEAWLHRAGFRSRGIASNFIMLEVAAVLLGGLLTLFILRTGVHDVAIVWLAVIPGGIGDFLAPVMQMAPVTIFVLACLAPVIIVRGRRRTLVEQVEKDLPMTLALLATLVESGLGLDAALDRLLQALNPARPLPREFLLLRSELQAGVDRVRCLRRMATRIQVPSVQIFVSAMIHSEQVGGGIASSLRRQADEVWNRRRERAIAEAQVMPTRLSVPLTLCFLPGIFVYTLGPALAEFLDIADGVVPAISQ